MSENSNPLNVSGIGERSRTVVYSIISGPCRHAGHSAAARAGRDGGEVVVVIPGGEVRRKTYEKFDGDNGLRVVGADLF